MTAAEAKELVDKFMPISSMIMGTYQEHIDYAKQCALICVNKIIEEKQEKFYARRILL